jgi:hypothetical protein
MISSSFVCPSAGTTTATTTTGGVVIGSAIVIRGWQTVFNIELVNSGAPPLANFYIDLQDHPDGEFYAFLSGTDFAGDMTDLMFCSTTVPNTLAGGGTAHVIFRVHSAYAVRFRALCDDNILGSTTTVKIRGSYSGVR